MDPIRIGAVNYLNTKPLIHDLETLAPDAELILDYPSRLADQLERGELDVGLIPIIEYFRAGDLSLVPGISIASDGPVLSVTLFSRKPMREIRSIALDEGSRTSAALVQILLRKRYGVHPKTQPLPLDQDAESSSADAVLLIGDRAMHACLPGFAHAIDLGQEWHDWTELPFVYAAWAVRAGVEFGPVAEALVEAKRRGLASVGPIAAREAPKLGLDAGFCRRYLSNIIRFDLGPRELAGMRRFHELACELGLARRGVEVKMYQAHGWQSVGIADEVMAPIEQMLALKKWKQARTLIQEAMVHEPADHWLWMHLGLTYYEEKDYEKALECSKRAVELEPNCALALWHYAGSLFMAGRESSAIAIWTILLDMDVEEVANGECGEGMDWALQFINDVHYRMGRYFDRGGKESLARASFEKYVHNREHGVGSIYDIAPIKKRLAKMAVAAS